MYIINTAMTPGRYCEAGFWLIFLVRKIHTFVIPSTRLIWFDCSQYTRRQSGRSYVTRVAKSFDDERIVTIYLSNIYKQRRENAAMVPTRKKLGKIDKVLLLQMDKTLPMKSPEENNCFDKLKKCLKERKLMIDQFIFGME